MLNPTKTLIALAFDRTARANGSPPRPDGENDRSAPARLVVNTDRRETLPLHKVNGPGSLEICGSRARWPHFESLFRLCDGTHSSKTAPFRCPDRRFESGSLQR